jgi:hypothetical protein
MIAAEHCPAFLQAVPNDSNTAVLAGGRKLVNGTFEAVECIGFIRNDYLKSFIVVIPASVAFRHTLLLWLKTGLPIGPATLLQLKSGCN